jgi:hypothetical protein
MINQILLSPNLQLYYRDKTLISRPRRDITGSASIKDYWIVTRTLFNRTIPEIECHYRNTDQSCSGIELYHQYLKAQTPHPMVLRLMLHILVQDRYRDMITPDIIHETLIQIIDQGHHNPDTFHTIHPNDYEGVLTPELAATIKPINSSIDVMPVLTVFHRAILSQPDKAFAQQLMVDLIKSLSLCTPPGQRPELFTKLKTQLSKSLSIDPKNAVGIEVLRATKTPLEEAIIKRPSQSALDPNEVVEYLRWTQRLLADDMINTLKAEIDHNDLSLNELIAESTKALKVGVIKQHIQTHIQCEQTRQHYRTQIEYLLNTTAIQNLTKPTHPFIVIAVER